MIIEKCKIWFISWALELYGSIGWLKKVEEKTWVILGNCLWWKCMYANNSSENWNLKITRNSKRQMYTWEHFQCG